jgi:hypothetical protein
LLLRVSVTINPAWMQMQTQLNNQAIQPGFNQLQTVSH